jgi:phosphatidylglycerol lysyltransferase
MHWKNELFQNAYALARNYPRRVALQQGILIIAGQKLWNPHEYTVSDDDFSRMSEELCSKCHEKLSKKRVFPCFFGLDTETAMRYDNMYKGQYLHAALGTEGYWHPQMWVEYQFANKSLRNSIHAASRHGVEVRVCDWDVLHSSANIREDFKRVQQEWLRVKRLPPLHFVAEPYNFGTTSVVNTDKSSRILLGAWQKDDLIGFIAGFLRRYDNTWYLDQCVRTHTAPQGTMELLIDAAMKLLAHNGQKVLATLGLMPLLPNPFMVSPHLHRANTFEKMLNVGAILASPLYNAAGLTHFKRKFHPSHEEVLWCSYHRSISSPRLALGLVESFCKQPVLSIALGSIIRKGIELH